MLFFVLFWCVGVFQCGNVVLRYERAREGMIRCTVVMVRYGLLRPRVKTAPPVTSRGCVVMCVCVCVGSRYAIESHTETN